MNENSHSVKNLHGICNCNIDFKTNNSTHSLALATNSAFMRIACILIFLISLFSQLRGQETVTILPNAETFYLNKNFSIIQDDEQKLSLEDVMNKDALFQSSNSNVIILGESYCKSAWIKFSINNKSGRTAVIEFAHAMVDSVTVYCKPKNGNVEAVRSGLLLPSHLRATKSNNQILILKGKRDSVQTYYARVTSLYPMGLKVRMGTFEAFRNEYHDEDLLAGFFIGIIALSILLNFLMYFAQKDEAYLWYGGYLMSLILMLLTADGFFTEWFFSGTPEFSHHLYFLINVAFPMGALLCLAIVDKTKYPVFLRKTLIFYTLATTATTAVSFFGCYGLTIAMTQFFALPIMLTGVTAGTISAFRGDWTAWFYVMGWLALSVCSGVYFADILGFNIVFLPSKYLIYFGIAAESVIFTIGITHRVSLLREEKEKAQGVAIESLENNQILIQEHNQILESKIEERTKELESAISEVNETKEELKLYSVKLEKSNHELTEFAQIVSHDLKAPLRNIASFTQLMNRRGQGKFDERDLEYMGYITASVKQSTTLINDLLSFSKLNDKDGELTEINSNELISEALENISAVLTDKNAAVKVLELPNLMGNETIVKMLFQNLITNGIKYNEDAKPSVEVGIAASLKGIVFYVKDNGIGIPPQYKDEIFRMFRRLHNSEKYEGSGIGLAFCKRIVDNYGGDIWMESTEGMGTTFFFTLPKALILKEQSKEKSQILI